MEHSLARIRGAVWLGLVGKGRVRSLGRNEKGEQGERWDNVCKPIIARYFIFGLKCAKIVWRPDSARTRWGSLRAPPGHLTAVGAREGKTV